MNCHTCGAPITEHPCPYCVAAVKLAAQDAAANICPHCRGEGYSQGQLCPMCESKGDATGWKITPYKGGRSSDFHCRIRPDLHQRLKDWCKENKVTMADWLESNIP